MKIMSITAQKPHSTGSGVYLTELVKGFAALGHEQAVVAGVYHEDTVQFPDKVHFFPVYFCSESLPFPIAGMSDEMPYESTVYQDMTDEMEKRFERAFLETITGAVDSFRPDVILCHHLYLLTALVRANFPHQRVAAVCHGTGLRQLQKNALRRDFIREQLPGLERVFALHTAQKETIVRLCGVPAARIAVVGSGYNDAVFSNLHLPKNPACPAVIYAGKLSAKKGVLSLLRAVQTIHTPLTVKLAGGAGNPQELGEMEALAKSCRHAVQFLGRLEQPDLARAFNESDVFVLPSFYEGLPLVLIEALACGLKAICTDLPGVRDWMDMNAPGHAIRFVPLPPLCNTDEPVPEALPAFEQALAAVIGQSFAAACGEPNLRGLTWPGVCARVLQFLSAPI